jgi:hypothetical protein
MSPRRYGFLAILILVAWIASGVAGRLGVAIDRAWPGQGVLALFPGLLLAGFVAWRWARCRACGLSVFEFAPNSTFRWSAPWPRRRCARCGADLTRPRAAAADEQPHG